MDYLWPWAMVAAAGALHGLNPATGWMFAAAWGVRSRDRVHAWKALLPIAIGHAASVALVPAAVLLLGWSTDGVGLQYVAGTLLLAVAVGHLVSRRSRRITGQSQPPRIPAMAGHATAGHAITGHSGTSHAGTRHAGLALWSFMMATAHGAGLMLIPALIPICMSNTSARQITASGSLPLAIAAVGVHTLSMLVVTGAVASAFCRGPEVVQNMRRIFAPRAHSG